MLKIGLVGCGRWGRLVLRDLVALGAEVSVVVRSNIHGAAYGGASNVVNSIAALPRMDGFVVATPTSTHAKVVDSLPQDVPVFCEKPLCDDVAQARRLVAQRGDRLFVMDKWRYHDGVLALAEIVRSGELGPIIGLRSKRLGWGHDYIDVDCVWTLLPHELAIAKEILGRLPPPIGAVADRVAGGVVGLTALFGTPDGPWHETEVSTRSPERRRVVTVLCRDGMARLDDAYADHVEVLSPPPVNGPAPSPTPVRRPIGTSMPLLTELRAFLAHLRGGPPPKSTAEEAAEAVEAIAAIRRRAGI